MSSVTIPDEWGATPIAKSPDDILTVADVAADFRIGPERIRKLVHSGELRHMLSGNKVLIPRWVMLEWVRDSVSSNPTPLSK